MKKSGLADLEKVTEAIFQKEHTALRPVLEAEAKVRQQLARLDAQVQQTRRDTAAVEGYRVTGTDVLWNGWESATRRNLNMELARLRGQKLEALRALRIAFGRKQAVKTLSETENEARKRALNKKRTPF